MGGDNFLTVIRTSSIWNWARIASAIVSARASKSWNELLGSNFNYQLDNLGVVNCVGEVIGFAGGGEVGRQLKVYFVLLPKLTFCFCDAVVAVKSNAFENDFVHYFRITIRRVAEKSPLSGCKSKFHLPPVHRIVSPVPVDRL